MIHFTSSNAVLAQEVANFGVSLLRVFDAAADDDDK